MNSFAFDTLLALALATAACGAPAPPITKVVGYLDAQAQKSLPLKHAPLEDLTHLVLSNAVKVDNQGQLHLRPRRFPWERSATELMSHVVSQEAPPYLVVSLRGFPDDVALDELAENEETRQSFVSEMASQLQTWGADGLELEWHADDLPGGKSQTAPFDEREQNHFQLLCRDLSAALRPLGKTLSVAVRPGRKEFGSGEPVRDFLDWLAVRAYSMRSLGDPHHSSMQDAMEALDEWRAHGVDPQQLLLISPLFARPGAALLSHSREAGVRRPWHEIVGGGLKATKGAEGDVFVEHDTRKAWFASGFNTTRAKVEHVLDGGYAGIGFRDLHHDSHEVNSLLQFASKIVRERTAPAHVVPSVGGLSLFQQGMRHSKVNYKSDVKVSLSRRDEM